jgi:preprotein translocase subunit SecG
VIGIVVVAVAVAVIVVVLVTHRPQKVTGCVISGPTG